MSKELEALNELERFVNEHIGIKCHRESGWHIADKQEYHLVYSALERKEKLEAVIELLKNEQFRNEISILEDCCWDYNNYLKIPASKLFNREIFDLLKEVLK